MDASIQAICSAFDGLGKAILDSSGEDRTMQEIWGWNFPALTRHDLAALATRIADRLREIDPDEVDESMRKRVNVIPLRVSALQGNTVPYLFNGHGAAAAPALMESLRAIEIALEPMLRWQMPDTNTLPPKLVKRLRTINAQLDEIDPNKDELKARIDLINQATEAAENLPLDLQSLDAARKRVDKAAAESEIAVKQIKQSESQSVDTLGTLAARKLEADALVANCEDAYRITTTKGLSAAFQQRASRLGWSVIAWVTLLSVALIGGALLGYHRIEIITNALKDDTDAGILWLQFALSALSVGAPLWFAWLATKQIGQRFKLAEDYAFKASVAKAYEGYRKEALRIDPELEKRLFASALDRLDEAPLRLVDQVSHGSPWAELMESKALTRALELYPETRETILSLAKAAIERSRSVSTEVPEKAPATSPG